MITIDNEYLSDLPGNLYISFTIDESEVPKIYNTSPGFEGEIRLSSGELLDDWDVNLGGELSINGTVDQILQVVVGNFELVKFVPDQG